MLSRSNREIFSFFFLTQGLEGKKLLNNIARAHMATYKSQLICEVIGQLNYTMSSLLESEWTMKIRRNYFFNWYIADPLYFAD